MKNLLARLASALFITVTLVSCAETPDLLEQNAASGTPTIAKQVLIVVDDKVFGAPFFGTPGRAYLKGLGTGLQDALPGIATSVVDVDSMGLGNPIPHALYATRPSHVLRVFTVSNKQRNGFPISAVWQLDVNTVAITSRPAADGKPSVTNFGFTPIYKARAEGDTCLESDTSAEKCGVTMGRFLGKAMISGHAVRVNSDG